MLAAILYLGNLDKNHNLWTIGTTEIYIYIYPSKDCLLKGFGVRKRTGSGNAKLATVGLYRRSILRVAGFKENVYRDVQFYRWKKQDDRFKI